MPLDMVQDLLPEQTWESLVTEAIIYCLSVNTALMAYLTSTPPITRQNPESLDTFVVSQRVMVWHEPASTGLIPQAGDAMEINAVFILGLVIPKNDIPILPGELTPTDWLAHMQRILELGTNGDGDGKLINPLADPDADPVELHLNRMKPEFRLGAKRSVSTSNTLWPLFAIYRGRSTRTSRRAIP